MMMRAREQVEKALDLIALIAQTKNVGERLVVLNELGLIAAGDVANVPHPQYGTFGKSEVIRGLVRVALDNLKRLRDSKEEGRDE